MDDLDKTLTAPLPRIDSGIHYPPGEIKEEQFLIEQTKQFAATGKNDDEALQASLTSFCQALFSLNEFVFVE